MKEIKSYVVKSVLSTLGVSLYILADTFFIANGVGVLGLTALNIALPLFSLLNALGLLLGMGGATLFALRGRQGNYFSQMVIAGSLLGLIFSVIGLVFPETIAQALGASSATKALTVTYLRFILGMAPFFILNNLVLAFIRNDNNPELAMKAMLASSLFNIIFDYIFVFPLGMGMAGAALATVLSPMLSLLILSTHRKFARKTLKWQWQLPQLTNIIEAIKLGLGSFLTEMSSGISILFFNMVLLSLNGDVSVAAYGVMANILLVGLALFTGVAQGIQPLISQAASRKETDKVFSYLKFGLKTSFVMATVSYLFIIFFRTPIIQIFNNSDDTALTQIASAGMPIFFLALFASCINLVLSIFFGAVGRSKEAFIVALLRGYLLIIPLVIILGKSVGITGVWASLPVTELLTLGVAWTFLQQVRKTRTQGLDKIRK